MMHGTMKAALLVCAGLFGLGAAQAKALGSASLPVEPGRAIAGQPNFFSTHSGDVIVEYYTGEHADLSAHFYDLATHRLILDDQAKRLAGDPRALLTVIGAQGWTPLRPSPRVTVGTITAEIQQLAGTSCGWVYPAYVAFHDSASHGFHAMAMFVPADGGTRSVTVQRDCEQSTGAMTLHARYREVFPALVAAPDGHGFLASFSGLPAILSLDANGRLTGPRASAAFVVTPGEVVATSFKAANAAGASAQRVLDRTDTRISSFSNKKGD